MTMLMTSLGNLMPLLQNRKVSRSSQQYLAVTTLLAWLLRLNQKLYALKLTALPQAIQIEQWFLQGWERAKQRLCRDSLRTLAQHFAEGSLLAEPDVVALFLDWRALEDEGHYNQVLNQLYGKGEALFDALVYPELVPLNPNPRQQ